MLNTSAEFQIQAAEDARWLGKAQLVLRNGTRVDLAGDDFAAHSFSFDQSTSSQGSFDIGAAITGAFKCTLDNGDRRFDDYDFTGSRIIPQVGLELGDGTVEWLRKGTFWVEQPSSYGETIGLNCYDSMSKLDRSYADVTATKYPATASTIVRDICAKCGIALSSAVFANYNTVFKRHPGAASCRQVLSWVCQATGNYARMTADDRLLIDWYDPTVFDDEDWLDGGEYDDAKPYKTGDRADGGNFDNYSSGDRYDGGSFDALNIASIYAYASATIVTDDVVVTGIRVTASDEVLSDGTKGKKGETVLAGSEGYVLEISDNPLISFGEASATAQRVAVRTVGLRFRPFDVSCIGDPSYEAGDPAILIDRYQNTYRAYLTRVCYKLGGYAALACSAETPLRMSAFGAGAVTRVKQQIEDDLRAEQTAREVAVLRFNDDLANAPGMYVTTQKENGAITAYMHDKKKLSDSVFVWKINSAGFGMSVDGGKTYAYGLDKMGNAILNVVYAIGLDASYIDTGALRVKNGSKTIFCADVDAGQFYWESTYSKLTNTGYLSVTGGNIGGFVITSKSMYKGRSSLSGSTEGVYVGTDGFAVGGKGNRYMAMSAGILEGGYNSTRYGWLAFFRNGWDNSSPAQGMTICSTGELILGCTKLTVCDPDRIKNNGGTLVALGTGQDTTVKVMVDLTISTTYENEQWMFKRAADLSVNHYFAKKTKMITSVGITRYWRTLTFKRGLLVKVGDKEN